MKKYLVLFLLGSIWVPFAADLNSFIAGRVVTAVGGGAMVPVAMAVIGVVAFVALLDRVGRHTVAEAPRGLPGDRMKVPAMPWATQPAVAVFGTLDTALAQGASLVGTSIIQCAVVAPVKSRFRIRRRALGRGIDTARRLAAEQQGAKQGGQDEVQNGAVVHRGLHVESVMAGRGIIPGMIPQAAGL